MDKLDWVTSSINRDPNIRQTIKNAKACDTSKWCKQVFEKWIFTWSTSEIVEDITDLVGYLLREFPESGFFERLFDSFDYFNRAFLGERISLQFVRQFGRHKFIDRHPLLPDNGWNHVSPANNKTGEGFVVNFFWGCGRASCQIEPLAGRVEKLVVRFADQIVLGQKWVVDGQGLVNPKPDNPDLLDGLEDFETGYSRNRLFNSKDTITENEPNWRIPTVFLKTCAMCNVKTFYIWR